MLSAMRKLFQYLYREKYRTDDPSAVLSSPKITKPFTQVFNRATSHGFIKYA